MDDNERESKPTFKEYLFDAVATELFDLLIGMALLLICVITYLIVR